MHEAALFPCHMPLLLVLLHLTPDFFAAGAAAVAAGLATLLFDLLTPQEAEQRHNVFDINLLASRLQLAVEWLESEGAPTAGRCPPDFPLGFFGASTGETRCSQVLVVVPRGGSELYKGAAMLGALIVRDLITKQSFDCVKA